jgi:flagellar basal-body rod modification protein FlgD
MSDIPVSYITGQAPVTTTPSTTSTAKQTLDSEGFLKLLIAQLENQDPSSPMDTSAMMQQTTQLAMMEQLTSMADDSSAALALQQRMLAASLVGADVTYATADGSRATGTVGAVTYSLDEPTLSVDGAAVDLSSVTAVAAHIA